MQYNNMSIALLILLSKFTIIVLKKYSLVYRFPFIVENTFQGIPCLYIPALKRRSINSFRYPRLVRITCIRRTYLYLCRCGRTCFKEVLCLYIPTPIQRAAEHVLKKNINFSPFSYPPYYINSSFSQNMILESYCRHDSY